MKKCLKSKFIIIRNEGGSRIIAITSFLPKEWQAIDATVIKSDNNSVTLKFVKVK